MKKIIMAAVAFLMIAGTMQAQENMFGKDDKVVNLGIGLLSGFYSGSFYSSKTPPISISFEQGIKDGVLDVGSIGVGGYLGYTSAKWEYLGFGWKVSNFIIGARGSFHYPLVDKLDTYAGVLLGYNVVTSKETGNLLGGNYSGSSSGVIFSGYVGGRYYFTDNIAAMVELGTGIAYFNIGVAFKF
ncbi:MAG: hypothetical protein CVT92_02770 [Bacteroidetes bacterium HGW-Bacteroidetes-1]|jgi:hypothetical protein|nr:MAG: hypothetical protein CVT92_02770 [Bacteroidetes bacterium HGW-Bacteroidetes-1]